MIYYDIVDTGRNKSLFLEWLLYLLPEEIYLENTIRQEIDLNIKYQVGDGIKIW